MSKKEIRVKLVRSPIGHPKKHRSVLVGMGLRRMNRIVTLEDTPAIRGMVQKVSHLVQIQE